LWVTAPNQSYPLALAQPGRDATMRRLMGAVMVVAMLAAYTFVVPIVNGAVLGLGFVADKPSVGWDEYVSAASAFHFVWGLAAAHLSLASITLIAWGFYRLWHHRRLGWLWSVSGTVRWRYGVVCLAVSVLVIGAVTAYYWVSGSGWGAQPGWVWYAVVIVVTTPFQALAEEVMFRGYLMQAFGCIVRQVWFPMICTAVIFALFHGTQNPWLFASRLVFGILAGLLVWRTGGLEAAVAIHVVNNLCALGLAVATGSLVEVRTTTSVDLTQAGSDVALFAVCAGACWAIAHGMKVPRRTPDVVVD
jgi:membrane protease YdiL (CAAX protease family)